MVGKSGTYTPEDIERMEAEILRGNVMLNPHQHLTKSPTSGFSLEQIRQAHGELKRRIREEAVIAKGLPMVEPPLTCPLCKKASADGKVCQECTDQNIKYANEWIEKFAKGE